MEQRIVQASIKIQKVARGFIERNRFKILQEENIKQEKQKLNNVLNELST